MKKFFLLFFLVSCVYTNNIYTSSKHNNKIIYGDSLKLFPKDEIFIEANLNGNHLSEFKIVNKIIDSSKTLIISLLNENTDYDKGTHLYVHNPFGSTLTYKAKIKPTSKIAFSPTSIMPVYPKILSGEMWPYRIESIILFDFNLEKK